MPPPVLPAQAPTNISMTSTSLERVGQRSKSQLEKPVVVMMEPTWNAAWRSATPRLSYIPWILRVMMPIATRMMRK